MQHHAFVAAEVAYRRDSLLAEAEAHRRSQRAVRTESGHDSAAGAHSRLVGAVISFAPRSFRHSESRRAA